MPCIIRPIAYHWSVTESNCCAKQLHDGIRYFDFRVAPHTITKPDFHDPDGKDVNQYEIVHCFYGMEVKKVLLEIYEFLKFHRREIVLLDFQWLYAMSAADHSKLINLIHQIFKDMLCPVVSSLNFVTLNWLWREQHQVLVFYRDIHQDPVPFIWPRERIPNPWIDTASPEELFRRLSLNYKVKRDQCFYVTQAILTPKLQTILNNLSEALSALAKEVNPRLLTWLQDKQTGSNGINVVITDFYDTISLHLPKHIIDLNYKIEKQEHASMSASKHM